MEHRPSIFYQDTRRRRLNARVLPLRSPLFQRIGFPNPENRHGENHNIGNESRKRLNRKVVNRPNQNVRGHRYFYAAGVRPAVPKPQCVFRVRHNRKDADPTVTVDRNSAHRHNRHYDTHGDVAHFVFINQNVACQRRGDDHGSRISPQNEIRHNVKEIAENLKQDDFLLFVLQRAESKKNHPEKR